MDWIFGKDEPRQPSSEEMYAGLQKNFHDNGRDLLNKDFNKDISTDASLEEVAKQLAKGYFENAYRYEYHELDYSNVRPPNSLGKNQAAHSFCRVDWSCPPHSYLIHDRLENDVFDALQLPDWAADRMKYDLRVSCDFIEEDTGNQWKYKKYTKFYDSHIEDRDSYQCDAIMVYCLGSARNDRMGVQIGFVYFAAIYYNVPSERKRTRDMMLAEAMESAAALSNSENIPHTMQDLKEVLEEYTAPRFEAEHGYRHIDNPPTSLRALRQHGDFVGRASDLRYIAEKGGPDLEVYIRNIIFEGLSGDMLPRNIRDDMISELHQQYMGITQDTDHTWPWRTSPFDKRFTHPDTGNHFRQTGVFVSRRVEEFIDDGPNLEMIHIYLMMVVYEEMIAKDRLTHLIFDKLNDPELATKGLDDYQLSRSMRSYAERRWDELFGFQFQDDKTQLPGTEPNRTIRSFAKPFPKLEYPIPTHDVEEWMNAELFQRHTPLFPLGVVSKIYDYVRDHTLAIEKDVNVWREVQRIKEFTWDSQHSRLKALKYYGLFVYALGEIANDKTEDGNADPVTMKVIYGYYLMAVGGVPK